MPNTICAILAAVALVVGIPFPACSQAPDTSKTVQQPHEDSGKRHHRPATSEQRTTEAAPVLQPPTSTTSHPSTNGETDKKQSSAEWGTYRATVALAVVTTLLMFFTALLWGATYALAKDAKKSAAQQARDVQASLALSRESANIATQAANAAILHAQAAVAVERPYVRVLDVSLAERDATHFAVVFTFTNYGRTPAFVTRIGYGFEIAHHPTVAEPTYWFTEFERGSVIEPQATRWLEAGLIEIPRGAMAAVYERTTLLWCWGQLQYRDFINGVAEMGFIGRYSPEKGAAGRIEEEAEFHFGGPDGYTYQRYTEGESQ
jgi:hypothetical protein